MKKLFKKEITSKSESGIYFYLIIDSNRTDVKNKLIFEKVFVKSGEIGLDIRIDIENSICNKFNDALALRVPIKEKNDLLDILKSYETTT